MVEWFISSKSGRPERNEDSLTVTGDVVAVFDGATTVGGRRREPTLGRLAAETLAVAAAGLPPRAAPAEVVERLHDSLRTLQPRGVGSASGAVLMMQTGRVIRVGDIGVGVNGPPVFPVKAIDRAAASARAMLLKSRLKARHSVESLRAADPGRQMILPMLESARLWRNTPQPPWGFAAFDGTATPAGMVDVIAVPDGAEVILASDGYAGCKATTVAEAEDSLAASVKADPLRITSRPGTKAVLPGHISFDDRTWIKVRVGRRQRR